MNKKIRYIDIKEHLDIQVLDFFTFMPLVMITNKYQSSIVMAIKSEKERKKNLSIIINSMIEDFLSLDISLDDIKVLDKLVDRLKLADYEVELKKTERKNSDNPNSRPFEKNANIRMCPNIIEAAKVCSIRGDDLLNGDDLSLEQDTQSENNNMNSKDSNTMNQNKKIKIDDLEI